MHSASDDKLARQLQTLFLKLYITSCGSAEITAIFTEANSSWLADTLSHFQYQGSTSSLVKSPKHSFHA